MDVSLLFSQLIRIEELNIWEGLGHVGCNREVYADALRIFCRELKKKTIALAEHLEHEDWKGYTAAIHAIIGGLAGVGAWELAQKARILEEASRDKNYQYCKKNSGKALEDMEKLIASLETTILFEEKATEREQVPIDYLKKKLEELYSACSSGNSVEADALAGELKTKTINEETDDIVSTICTHVENLDYHLVLQILSEYPLET